MKNKRILLAALSVCGVMLFATACQKPTEQSLTLYAEEEYQYKIVCSTQIDAEEASAITAFTDLLEKRCGKAPELVYDSGAEDTEGVPEILIGKLNRLESKLPDLKEQETYWCVTTKGEDIVINGSTSTALQVAMDYFMSLCDYDKESATFHVSGTLAQEHRQDGYYRDRWLLREIPSYWGNNELDGFVYDCGSTKPNTFCLGIILCRVSHSFDYLIYPYYPAYTSQCYHFVIAFDNIDSVTANNSNMFCTKL